MTARRIAAVVAIAGLAVGCATAAVSPAAQEQAADELVSPRSTADGPAADTLQAAEPPASAPRSLVTRDDCAIPGDMAHWQADYCMAQVETDDIIAAGPCLERETAVRFRSACDAKHRYKAGMCELAVANGSRTGSVEACVADPLFVGHTVRNGGA